MEKEKKRRGFLKTQAMPIGRKKRKPARDGQVKSYR